MNHAVTIDQQRLDALSEDHRVAMAAILHFMHMHRIYDYEIHPRFNNEVEEMLHIMSSLTVKFRDVESAIFFKLRFG